jgi:hypothetical protein
MSDAMFNVASDETRLKCDNVKLVVIENHVCETEILDRQSALRSTSYVWRWQGRSTTSWQAAPTFSLLYSCGGCDRREHGEGGLQAS